MKRSEMIQLIVEALNKKHTGEYVNTEEFPERISNTMLDVVEEKFPELKDKWEDT